ncbi:MAG: ribonuclease HII [Chloroflexota bacterium]|nr:ribonuclease HII [Chloroflexota bacterium]
MPTLNHEKGLWQRGFTRVVGVDEVGMATLAGPVVAAACLVTPDVRLIRRVRDSKLLTREEREKLVPLIRGRVAGIGIGAASVAEIHRLNIYHASHLAMLRALRQIGEYDHVLVDGRRILDPNFAPGKHSEIVRGDMKSFAIAAASIVAKVTRDHLMAKLAVRFPGYGWEHNAGYPTPDHRAALHERGVTPVHRRDFGTVKLLLLGEQTVLDLGGAAAEMERGGTIAEALPAGP